jgi:hypothetical protein
MAPHFEMSNFRKLAPSRNVFSYRYEHVGSFSLADIFGSSLFEIAKLMAGKAFGYHATKRLGVAHADDVLAVFK